MSLKIAFVSLSPKEKTLSLQNLSGGVIFTALYNLFLNEVYHGKRKRKQNRHHARMHGSEKGRQTRFPIYDNKKQEKYHRTSYLEEVQSEFAAPYSAQGD
jgi:hypothetical protein